MNVWPVGARRCFIDDGGWPSEVSLQGDNDWVLDLDIKSFFDEIDWGLLMLAVRRHTDCKWVLLYLQRWLEAPVSMPDVSSLCEIEEHRRGQ